MKISTKTRNSIGAIVKKIRQSKKILVSSHIKADGDGLGSGLALVHMLRKMGKNVHMVCDHGAIPEYRWLPGAHEVGANEKALNLPYDCVITCDAATYGRLECVAKALPRDSFIINIDHHISNERFGKINWIEPKFASSGEMVYVLARIGKFPITLDAAINIYTAMVTDTGDFMFSNTTTQTHEIAIELMKIGVKPAYVAGCLYRQNSVEKIHFLARVLSGIKLEADGCIGYVVLSKSMYKEFGFEPQETQEYVNFVKSIKDVKVAILFRENNDCVKLSVRTSEDIDAVELCSIWGGGGHARASGATLKGTLDSAIPEVIAKTKELLEVRQRHA